MLVLSRKCTESIIINNNIVVTFLEFNKGQARISIDAPREIPVHRREVQDRINSEKINLKNGNIE